jgi:phosphoglycolate phosphatase-like HAD superfamily hydrolase
MDGTLLSLPVEWPEVRAKLAEQAGTVNFQPVFDTLGVVLRERPGLRATLLGTLDEYELRADRSALLHEGTRRVIELLSRTSKLAIVTMQGKKIRDRLLQRFALERYFSVFLSREDSLDRAEQIEMAIRALSISKGESVFVGDRLNDLNAARKVGVEFVLIRNREDAQTKFSFPDMSSFGDFLLGGGS